MSARTYTPIAVFQGGEAFASTLEHQIATSAEIERDTHWIRDALGRGEVFMGGDSVDAFAIVSLHHRDAPSHAAEALDLSEMDSLLRVFCWAFALPHMSADELLASINTGETASFELVNWLSNYVDAYMDHREYGKAVTA